MVWSPCITYQFLLVRSSSQLSWPANVSEYHDLSAPGQKTIIAMLFDDLPKKHAFGYYFGNLDPPSSTTFDFKRVETPCTLVDKSCRDSTTICLYGPACYTCLAKPKIMRGGGAFCARATVSSCLRIWFFRFFFIINSKIKFISSFLAQKCIENGFYNLIRVAVRTFLSEIFVLIIG